MKAMVVLQQAFHFLGTVALPVSLDPTDSDLAVNAVSEWLYHLAATHYSPSAYTLLEVSMRGMTASSCTLLTLENQGRLDGLV